MCADRHVSTLFLRKAVNNSDILIIIDTAKLVWGYDKLEEFCDTINLTNFTKSETCYTDDHKPSIDLFFTNIPLSFQGTSTTEIGLSDCHKLISTFTRSFVSHLKPKNIFSKLQKVWCNKVLNWFEKCKFLFYLCRSEWKLFLCNSFSVIDEKHVILKKKTLRENHLYSKEINPYFFNIISKGTITKTFGKLYNLFWQKRLFWK